MSEGELYYLWLYIGGFVLLTFVELVRLALNESAQYKTEVAFARPIAVAFSNIYIYRTSIWSRGGHAQRTNVKRN